MTPASLDECQHHQIVVLAAGAPRGLGVSPQYYYLGLAILVVLMAIALVKAYRMWEEIQDVVEPDSPTALLETFERAHATGELNDAEYERVRQRLADPMGGDHQKRRPSRADDRAPDGA